MEVVLQRRASKATNEIFIPKTPLQECFRCIEHYVVRTPAEYSQWDAEEKLQNVKRFGPQVEVRNVFSNYMRLAEPRDILFENSNFKILLLRPKLNIPYENCISFMDQIGSLQAGAEGICFLLYQLRVTLYLNEQVRQSCLVSLESQHSYDCAHNLLRYPLVKHNPQKLTWEFDLGMRTKAIGPESLLVCFVPV